MLVVDFEVEVSHTTRCVVLALRGELDMASRSILQSRLEQHPLHEHIVLDMLEVKFLDSSGLQLILLQALDRQEAGGSLLLRNCVFPVRQVIDLTGLIHLFEDDDGTGLPDMGTQGDLQPSV